MRIPKRGLVFDKITYHGKVTQCLGGLSPHPWYIVVAAPTGSVRAAPGVSDLNVFRVPFGSFLRMKVGSDCQKFEVMTLS